MAIKCKPSLAYNRKLMLIALFKNFLCEVECKEPRCFKDNKDKVLLENHKHESKL